MNHIKTWLFVPATKVTRIAKAWMSGADAVIVDLEDAVALEDKAQARKDLLEYLAQEGISSVWLRVNKAASTEFFEDLELCYQSSKIAGIILAKAQQRSDIEQAHSATNLPIIALIESALGLYNLEDLAKAKGLAAISYGFLDLCNDLQVQYGTPAADMVASHIRYQLILLSKVQQLAAPIDTIYPDFNDSAGLMQRVKLWSQMGMSGMLCIHPKQVAAVYKALDPSDREVEFAKQVVAEYESSKKAVFQINGIMVDAPVIERCYQILAHKAET